MDYIRKINELIILKRVAVRKGRRLANKVDRLEILLANALTILEENGFGGESFAVTELGMTHKEYKEIMGE